MNGKDALPILPLERYYSVDNLDFLRASKLIREFEYIGLQVRSASGNFSYVLFIQEEIYKEKGKHYQSYPPSSAMFTYMADYIYDYRLKKWTKQRSPIELMKLTPAEMVLYGKTE